MEGVPVRPPPPSTGSIYEEEETGRAMGDGDPEGVFCVEDALLAFPLFPKTTRVNLTPGRCW